jgi:cell shape-determining protein MreC
MSIIRFNHLFLGLMAASGVASFILPPTVSGKFKGRADGLFTPVAYPLRKVAGGIARQFNKSSPMPGFDVASAPADARHEIERLRSQVAVLTVQLVGLKELSAGRELIGEAHKYAVPLKVIGNDPGGRDALILAGSTADAIKRDDPVLRADALVGRISNVTGGGAQVRLITDRGSAVSALIGRFRQAPDGKRVEFVATATPPPLVEGRGNGAMSITSLTMAQVQEAGVAKGDYVVLKDDAWPLLVNGFLIGTVESIGPSLKSPQFAEITVKPRQDLTRLSEVMVVNKTMAPPAPQQREPVRPIPVSNPPQKRK